jgi:hypothetical protein
MNKFEQLIEYVINDEDEKAKELFHEIVVEKSRQIYEDLMQDDLAEAKHEEEGEEEGEEMDEAAMGGRASGQMIKNIKAKVDGDQEGLQEDGEEEEEEGEEEEEEGEEESSMSELDDSDSEEMGADDMDMSDDEVEVVDDNEEDLEDRVVDLEDKLDELMAEFESMMGDQDMGDADGIDDMNPDALAVDDTAEMDADVSDMDAEMMEAVTLKKAPSAKTTEEGFVQKKSTVKANSGGDSPISKQVKPVMSHGADEKGRSAPNTKDLIGKVQNTPAQSSVKLEPATKPHLAQASGVNTKSPVKGQ